MIKINDEKEINNVYLTFT